MGGLGSLGQALGGGGLLAPNSFNYLNDVLGGKQTSSKQNTLPAATPMQSFAENQLLNILQGYNPYTQQQGLAHQTGNTLQQLLNYGMNPTPQQTTLLEGQTGNYMQGLTDYLNQWQKGAMGQAQQSALSRGIPLSDIARGQEANVQSQYGRQLAQGYNTAKGQELQNKLQYPMQNLNLMAGLNQQFTSPLQQLLSTIGMSRYGGPRDVTEYGTNPGQGFKDFIGGLGSLGQGLGSAGMAF